MPRDRDLLRAASPDLMQAPFAEELPRHIVGTSLPCDSPQEIGASHHSSLGPLDLLSQETLDLFGWPATRLPIPPGDVPSDLRFGGPPRSRTDAMSGSHHDRIKVVAHEVTREPVMPMIEPRDWARSDGKLRSCSPAG